MFFGGAVRQGVLYNTINAPFWRARVQRVCGRWTRLLSGVRAGRRRLALEEGTPTCGRARQKRAAKLRGGADKIPVYENERPKRRGSGARPHEKMISKPSGNEKRRESVPIDGRTRRSEFERRLQNVPRKNTKVPTPGSRETFWTFRSATVATCATGCGSRTI